MSFIGVNLGVTHISVGKVSGHRLSKIASTELDSRGSVTRLLDAIYQLIDLQFDSEIESIGFGVPGPVDLSNGVVRKLQNIPAWREIHLKDLMKKRYMVPVYLDNDANCFALGEKRFGKLKPYQNGLALLIGTGLGAGMILDGRLYSGRNCSAGEFGTIPYNNGNFEDYCSGKFFINAYGVRGETVYQRAKEGDAHALKIFSEFGIHLGNVIKVILGAVDPEIIVLGGAVSRAFPFFEADMWASIRMYDFLPPVEQLKVEVSETGHVGVLGAATLHQHSSEAFPEDLLTQSQKKPGLGISYSGPNAVD